MGKLVRALSADGSVLCSSVDATDICNEIVRIHQPSPVATAAMGRLSAAGSLIGALMKEKTDALTLRINGGGVGGTIVAVSDYMGNVRCCCDNPTADLPLKPNGKLDVGGFVGRDGFLAVIRDLGLKEPHVTQSPIVSGEIAEDITSYYALSEQIPTVCALGVLVDRDHSVKAAGGYIIQLVPPVNEAAIDFIEKNIKHMQSVTEMMTAGKTPEEIALMGLEGLNGEVLDSWECGYKCKCSRERTERMLISLGKKELLSLAEESEKDTEVVCQFCGKKYYFGKDELTKMADGTQEREDRQ